MDIIYYINKIDCIAGKTRSVDFARSITCSIVSNYWTLLNQTQGSNWKLSPFFDANYQILHPVSSLEPVLKHVAQLLSKQDICTAGYLAGSLYAALLPKEHRSKFGVYFTPPVLSSHLLNMSEDAGVIWRKARILDPACGGGAFLIPLALKLLMEFRGLKPRSIIRKITEALHGYEIDPFTGWLSQVFVETALLSVCLQAKMRMPRIVTIKNSLFDQDDPVKFDLIIGNPPYVRSKLSNQQREYFKRGLYGHANLYGLFTDKALRIVNKNGIIAFVTPTSFLAGQYFKNLRLILAELAPPMLLDFVSEREGVFSDVLQETILATYVAGKSSEVGWVNSLRISNNDHLNVLPVGKFRLPKKKSNPWIIPRSVDQCRLVRTMAKMTSRLVDYGYQVSTGPLVWNRHKEQLCNNYDDGNYPLIWAEAVGNCGDFIFRAEKKNHTLFFKPKDKDGWLLVRNPCILLQRTTSKEQKRRLIAAMLPLGFLKKYGAVVIENHLNIILTKTSKPKIGIESLVMLLNSYIVDQAFRCMNGSVAVSAFELGSLPLPSLDDIDKFDQLVKSGATQPQVDRFLERIYLNAKTASAA